MLEVLLGLAIAGVLVALSTHLLRYERAISERVEYTAPNVRDQEVTIPGRPHAMVDFRREGAKPGTLVSFRFSTNTHGHRHRELDPRTPGSMRIACVGECVAYGVGVNDDQTYCHLLERMLAEAHPERSIEVVNASVVGAPDRVRERLEESLPLLEPDLVVYAPGAPRGGGEGSKAMESYRRDLVRALDASHEQGSSMVLVTPTCNSFFSPAGPRYVEEVLSFAVQHELPCVNTTSLLLAMERWDGLLYSQESGVQRLTAYRNGQPELLLELPRAGKGAIAPEVYAYLEAHPELSQLASIDDNHPNARGHEAIAREVLGVVVGILNVEGG